MSCITGQGNRRRKGGWMPVFSAGLLFVSIINITWANQAANCPRQVSERKFYGINFSPYVNRRDPRLGTILSAAYIRLKMKLLVPVTRRIRVFGMSGGMQQVGRIAREFKLQVVLQAWLGRDLAANEHEIRLLIQSARAGHAKVLIVGSEVLLRKDLNLSQLIGYIRRVKQAVPHLTVTTAEVDHLWFRYPSLVRVVDEVYVNLYPFWMGVEVRRATSVLARRYSQLKKLAGKKRVVIAETGWPSRGKTIGQAVPSVTNATLYLNRFLRWQRRTRVPAYLFSAFDERWKIRGTGEGEIGGAWGLYDGQSRPKYRHLCNRAYQEQWQTR